MNKVTCGITMSLDAFVAGPNQSFEKPFGDIPETLLHGWMFEEPEKHQAQLLIRQNWRGYGLSDTLGG